VVHSTILAEQAKIGMQKAKQSTLGCGFVVLSLYRLVDVLPKKWQFMSAEQRDPLKIDFFPTPVMV